MEKLEQPRMMHDYELPWYAVFLYPFGWAAIILYIIYEGFEIEIVDGFHYLRKRLGKIDDTRISIAMTKEELI